MTSLLFVCLSHIIRNHLFKRLRFNSDLLIHGMFINVYFHFTPYNLADVCINKYCVIIPRYLISTNLLIRLVINSMSD